MKVVNGFSSEIKDDKGKADSALPLSSSGGIEEIDEQKQNEGQVKQLDAFGSAGQLETTKEQQDDTASPVAEEAKHTDGVFFKGITVEDDEFDDDVVQNEAEPVADVELKQVEDVELKQVEEHEQVEQTEPKHVEEQTKQIEEPVKEVVNKTSPKKTTSAAIKVKTVVNGFDNINEHPIRFLAMCANAIYATASKLVKRTSLNKLVKKGVKVQSGDFEFVKVQNYLILTKYSGVSNVVKIPAFVGNLPVKYIHSDFLYSGVNPFDNYKVRSVVTALKGLSTNALAEDAENKFVSDVTEIELPNTLVAISDGTFVDCYGIHELIIPKSVQSFNFGAIKNSGISALYFNGDIPKGFNVDKFKGDIFVREDV